MKTINILLLSVLSLFAIYGIIILIQKIRYDGKAERVTKGINMKYWIEPFRADTPEQTYCRIHCPRGNCNDQNFAAGCWAAN